MSILVYIVQYVVKNILGNTSKCGFKILAIPLLPDLKKMEKIRSTGTSNKPIPNSSIHTKPF